MGRLVTALLLVISLGAAGAAYAGPLTDECRGVSEALRGPCRGAEQAVSYASAISGLSAVDVSEFEGSWTDRALALQYGLAADVPLRNAPWVGTHNSFNSVAEMGPTLSDLDSNQQLSLVDQLRIGVRSIELDVHWFPSLARAGRAPVVCHARGAAQGHAGCSIEKPLDATLEPVAAWLADHPDQVLLLYLEDHLENADGHAAGATAVEAVLGDRVYRPAPAPGSCEALPLEARRADVQAAGKQVVIVSTCGTGAPWQGLVFDWSSHKESRPRGFEDFPSCGPDFSPSLYESEIIRYYEDSTALTAGAATAGAQTTDDGITPETAARMARCGVDLTGLDQLVPSDGRLEALVWSWAPGEPSTQARCSVQRPDGRWEGRRCGESRRAACRTGAGGWITAGPSGPAATAERRCAAAGAVHAVPRTGRENSELTLAAGGDEVWLGQRPDRGGWSALDAR